jgi:hypothetical protein
MISFTCPTDDKLEKLGGVLLEVTSAELKDIPHTCHCGKVHRLDITIDVGVYAVDVLSTEDAPEVTQKSARSKAFLGANLLP